MPANSLGVLNAPGQSDIHDLYGSGQMCVRASLVSQSTATNSSVIRFQFFVYSPTAFNWTYTSNWRIQWRANSGAIQTKDHIVVWGASEYWQTFDDFQVTVQHDNDGKCALWFQGSYGATGTSLGGPQTLGSKTWQLPQISRVPDTPKIRWDAATQALIYATDAQIHVYPPNQNGAPIDKYTYRWAPAASGSTMPTTFSWLEHNGNICNLASAGSFNNGSGRGPLLRGTRYLVEAQCHNKYGYSGNSAVVAFITQHTAPDKPPTPTLTSRTATSATLAGSNPAYVGAGVTSTRWEISPTSDFATSSFVGTATTATFTGLKRYTNFWVRRKIANSVGESPWSDALKVTTLQAVPTAIRNLATTQTATTITATWDPPVDDGGSPITGYLVSCDSFTKVVTEPTVVFSGLTPNQTYLVTVKPLNEIGEGPSISIASFTLIGSPKLDYKLVKATALELTFSWDALPQGAPVDTAAATVLQGSTLIGVFAPGTYTFEALPGVEYTIEMAAASGVLLAFRTEIATALPAFSNAPVLTGKPTPPNDVLLSFSVLANVPVTGWEIDYGSGAVVMAGAEGTPDSWPFQPGALGKTAKVRAVSDYGVSLWSNGVWCYVDTTYTSINTPTATADKTVVAGNLGVQGYNIYPDFWRIQFAIDSSFSDFSLVYDGRASSSSTSFESQPMLALTDYYVRYCGVTKYGDGPWSNWTKATTSSFYSVLMEENVFLQPNAAIYTTFLERENIWLSCDTEATAIATVDMETEFQARVFNPKLEAMHTVTMNSTWFAVMRSKIDTSVLMEDTLFFDAQPGIEVKMLECIYAADATPIIVTVKMLENITGTARVTPNDYADTLKLQPEPEKYKAEGWI